MLGLVDLVCQWLLTNRVADLAERVAGRSRALVWERVEQRLSTLGPTECRGYLRVRALEVVREEMTRLIEQEGTSVIPLRRKIQEAAVASLIETITSQLAQRRSQRSRAAA